MIKETDILNRIQSPKDLKKLSTQEQKVLCDKVRWTIIKQLSKTSGHFGASLGVVELTVALHSVFNTPEDKLVWDVGHQCYAHKIITERKDHFESLRQFGGISGFPSIKESIYDDFGTGHSSTSISAVLGMAVASELDGCHNRQHIAVIGDGALSAGMAFEALNNASSINGNVLIIINDNQQSIDDSVGGLEKHFRNLSNNKENFFENLGLAYYGIVNANNYEEIKQALQAQKDKKGIRVLHCKTVKGYGYHPAETGDASVWHAPGKFEIETGKRQVNEQGFPMKYQDVFGRTLVDLAEKNDDIVAITPAMKSGSSLHWFKERFPTRFFDVGIAEQHAVTFAGGLAKMGKLPFCVIYSTFLQRAYDQLIHDVALQELPVVFCVDRAGLVGEDGATHQGIFDIAFLRAVPNLLIVSPRNEQELINALYWATEVKKTVVVRYPRGRGKALSLTQPTAITTGKGTCLRKGENIALLSIGQIANEVEKAIVELNRKGVYPSHYDLRFVKPLDMELLTQIATTYKRVVVVEEGTKLGGVGSAVLEFFATIKADIKTQLIGIDDKFVEHGTIPELYDALGISAPFIVKACL